MLTAIPLQLQGLSSAVSTIFVARLAMGVLRFTWQMLSKELAGLSGLGSLRLGLRLRPTSYAGVLDGEGWARAPGCCQHQHHGERCRPRHGYALSLRLPHHQTPQRQK